MKKILIILAGCLLLISCVGRREAQEKERLIFEIESEMQRLIDTGEDFKGLSIAVIGVELTDDGVSVRLNTLGGNRWMKINTRKDADNNLKLAITPKQTEIIIDWYKNAKLSLLREKEQLAAQKHRAEQKKRRPRSNIEKYGERVGALIDAGRVEIGFTQEMCRSAWGKPYTINRTINAYGVHEQWVYNLKSYLYFEDGILTTIQN